jgi:hypothetical protein
VKAYPTKQKLIEQIPPQVNDLHLQKLEGDKAENDEDSGSGETSIGT